MTTVKGETGQFITLFMQGLPLLLLTTVGLHGTYCSHEMQQKCTALNYC